MSIEEKMDMLRRKIKAGALGADDARRALRAEIDGELRKAPADVDMDAVNAWARGGRGAAGGGARVRRHGDGLGAFGQRPHQTA